MKEMLTTVKAIVLAFVMNVNGPGGAPAYDFSLTSKNCTLFEGTNLPNCPQIGYASCSQD